ncbi:hypothetical protein C8034_v008739 [Colletotrichum sidae]|uniref:Uncharacterized protein n=1 Tax=Colletotrichum sidae TaxID=1347389 RepID=A0A4R8TNG1_9PEZI|nr:hypothetical protein C8034_v008739 [Colletotrichum sidae]
MAEPNPITPSAPAVSKMTIHMSGLLCDVYGLSELATERPASVSCLWLFHGRLQSKEIMGDFASRVVSRHATQQQPPLGGGRGLIAVAFDQRNHGTRLVLDTANGSWRDGNATHAVDMFGMVAGMVSDTRGLMDVVEGYVKNALALAGGGGGGEWQWELDQHLALGVSLGGHSTWQALFAEEMIEAGVVIIGCPDYMDLMMDRAKKSKLATWRSEDSGASFLGSRDFPPDLVDACLNRDPKGILFGTGVIPPATEDVSEAEKQRLRGLLDAHHVKGKKFLVCSGADDKLVPYDKSRAFIDFFEMATKSWYADAGVTFENVVYEGVGHTFSEGMVEDSIRFLLDAVKNAGGRVGGKAKI